MRAYNWGIRIFLLVAVSTSLIASAIIVTSTVTLNGQGTIGVQGNPPVEFRSFQVLPWFEVAGEQGLAGVLAFVTLVAFSAWAGWTGHTAVLATGSLLTLAFSYVTGFSIGRGYFPASVLLLLSLAATAFLGVIRRQHAR